MNYLIIGFVIGLIPGICVAANYHYKKWKNSK